MTAEPEANDQVDDKADWIAPGPGSWICDRSHNLPGPTRLYRRIVSEHTAPTYRGKGNSSGLQRTLHCG